jgi:hypothetical protein
MPPTTRRLTRAKTLVWLYLRHQKQHNECIRRRLNFLKRHADHNQVELSTESFSDLSPESFDSDADTSDRGSYSSAWSRSNTSNSSENDSEFQSLAQEDDNESLSSSMQGLEAENLSEDADDEGSDGDEEFKVPLRHWVQNEIETMYAHRYEMPRDKLPQGPSYMQHVLTVEKNQRPDHFHLALRVSPITFDKILAKISDDPIFFNNSNNPQRPVEDQLAIVLYRFGHNGNAASLEKVTKWAGAGKGTITLATHHVMTAILCQEFMQEAVCFPSAEEKEEAMAWVEAHSCKAWRCGWCLVDGTLIPLYACPTWFGESYFDRKCNYSLNIQVRSFPSFSSFLQLIFF